MDRTDTAKEKVILYTEDSATAKSADAPFVQNLAKFIGLPQLTKGVEGLWVRIWVWYPDSNYIITIVNNGLEKKCDIIDFYGKRVDSAQYIAIRKWWTNLVPKSGWNQFFDMMQQHAIATLPPGNTIEELSPDLTGGAYIQFEVAEGNNYRYFKYFQPDFFRYVDSASGHIYEFLKYINTEMNITVYRPTEHMFMEPKYK